MHNVNLETFLSHFKVCILSCSPENNKINVPPYPRLLALTLTHQICCWSPSVKQPPSITAPISPYYGKKNLIKK